LTTALANAQGRLNPLKELDPIAVLERYMAGENSTEIAESLGVTKGALSLFMLKNAEDVWKDAQIAKALIRKESAEYKLETADNPLDLARAREMLKAAQWDLERVARRIYGQDAPAQLASIVINVGAIRNAQDSTQVIDIKSESD
jgi:hypothetical protein